MSYDTIAFLSTAIGVACLVVFLKLYDFYKTYTLVTRYELACLRSDVQSLLSQKEELQAQLNAVRKTNGSAQYSLGFDVDAQKFTRRGPILQPVNGQMTDVYEVWYTSDLPHWENDEILIKRDGRYRWIAKDSKRLSDTEIKQPWWYETEFGQKVRVDKDKKKKVRVIKEKV